jgi:uncharacterized alkaline shock family protein YloU
MNRHPPSAHQTSHAETTPAQPSPDPLGSVRITRQVLATIIEHAALEVEGVSRLAPMSSPWPRLLFRAQPQHGIALNVHGETVAVDLYLILDTGAKMAQIGRNVQDAVAHAIEDLLGMTAGEINVYIQDVA